jgi:hypothetical protein
MTVLARRYVPDEISQGNRPHNGQAAAEPLSLMGLNNGSESDRVALVRSGLPTSVIEGLARSLGISQRELLAAAAIAPATLARRRNAGGRLSPRRAIASTGSPTVSATRSGSSRVTGARRAPG